VYKTVHTAIARCASDFGFDPQWFKPHSIRMSAPTVLRAAGGDDGEILTFGTWKQVPTSLIYQGTSTKNNNRWLRAISNTELFTAADISLTRLLPAVKGKNQQRMSWIMIGHSRSYSTVVVPTQLGIHSMMMLYVRTRRGHSQRHVS
jgi:hypothetical protein